MIDTELPPFPGFRPEAFAFLRQLAANNERDWFKPRKDVYDDEVLWPLRCLLADAAREAARLDLPLTTDPKRSIFRIYRDTRFSKNKQPYKTHAGAVLSRSGSHKDVGVLYIHVQPDECFLGAGFWRPDSALIRAWRARMVDEPSAFLEIVDRLDEPGLTLNGGDLLKRMPRGFEAHADTDIAEYLRWKSFLVTQNVADEDLQSPDFVQTVVDLMKTAHPLLAYGWEIQDRAEVNEAAR